MISLNLFIKSLGQNRHIFSFRSYAKPSNPFVKTWDILSKEIRSKNKNEVVYPEHTDIVIIGGGFIGASVAYWLKTKAGAGLSVVILEKDLQYTSAQNNLSLGILSQHYQLPENIYLSQYSNEFFRNIKGNLNSDTEIQFCPTGNLILASEKYAERLEQNITMLKEFGIKNELLTTTDLKKKFPWINLKDIELGCISSESEGVFNPWALLKGLIIKNQELGATFVNAEVVGFEFEHQRDVLSEGVTPGSYQRISKVVYRTMDGEEHTLKFAACVLAAGNNSGEIAQLAKIGNGTGLLTVPLPIERRDFNIYSIEDNKNFETSLNVPYIMDTSGLWLRKNGLENNFICAQTPLPKSDLKETTETYYNNIIYPSLLNRYHLYENTQIKKIKTEMYDCNTYDDTGILGSHAYYTNLIIAAGFGKLGCQHAPGIGRAVSELIIEGQYVTTDLTRFGFDRLLVDDPLIEFNIY